MKTSSVEMENSIIDSTDRLSALSIVIDDFDSSKYSNNTETPEASSMSTLSHQHQPSSLSVQRSFSNRLSTNDSIQRILDEAERRKHEFWKLIEEHNALIQYLKRIEQLENNGSIRKPTAVST